MKTENKTNGKLVKIISALMMCVGMVGTVAESEACFGVLFLGFIGFVVGRFMD